jgi:hypothetical protein
MCYPPVSVTSGATRMTAGTCGRIRTCIAGMAPIRGAAAPEAEQGVISNWQNSAFDLRPRQSAAAKPWTQVVIISGETATVPPGLALLIHDCERSVFQVRAHGAAAVLTATKTTLTNWSAVSPPKRTRNPPAPSPVSDRCPERTQRSPTRGEGAQSDPHRAGHHPSAAVVCRAGAQHALRQICVKCQVAPRHLTIGGRRAPLPPASTPGSATGRSEVATASST